MSMKSRIADLHNSIPLPMKMVVLTIIVSLSVWVALDYFQTKELRSIYHAELTVQLNKEAMDSRSGFNRYVKSFQDTSILFVTQKKFSDYIKKQGWSATDNIIIKYTGRSPEWFPKRSMIRTFASPRHALLLDPGGRVREVYSSRKEPIPQSLLNPTQILIHKSHDQIFMTNLDEIPYTISSEPYYDQTGKLLATLVLASPLDNEFIYSSLKYFSSEHLVALLTAGEDPHILTSNNLEILPVGASVRTLQDQYLVTGKEFFDYGASEIQIKLASFISLAKIDKMTNASILASRHERAMTAFTLIIVFTLIMYWITRHITNISKRINDFSKHTLGMKPRSLKKGDQLHVLKERFHELTKEIMEMRKTIKSQAEEKTRLIVESAFDAIATTDAEGTISSWNPTAETLFGWTSEEALGKPIYDVIVPPLHTDQRDPIKSIITDNKNKEFRSQLVLNTYHRNGHEMPVEFSVSSARQEKDPVLIFIMRDTTERTRSEKRIHHLLATLTKAKEEWEKTFDSVTEQIILVDRHLNIIRSNKSFAKAMRSSVHELIGRKCDEFMLCDQAWLSGIKNNKEQSNRTEVRTYDGHWLYVSTLPIYDKNNNFLYSIITATDITELKKTQKNLTESKQELNERVSELENFYDMAVNRELKMIKLKEKVKKLKVNNGNGADKTKEENSHEAPNSAYLFNKKKPGPFKPA